VQGTIQMLHNGNDGAAVTVGYQYQSGDFKGAGDNATAIAIAQLRNAMSMAPDGIGNNTATFAEYYSSFIGTLGLTRNEASSNLETRSYLVANYEAHQDSIAGVSLDEEMANLIRYQHTYQASARVISITNEMLDVLMRM
jgi:flagellar hook-associated protein 1 FlgK